MLLLGFAICCAGVFCGAAVYVNAVEHPARVSCGTELAIREFAPSYRRGTIMQATLAVVGCLAGLLAAALLRDVATAVAALLLGLVVLFTVVVIFPTNRRLLDPRLDVRGLEAQRLLARWNALHAVRTGLSGLAFVILVWRLAVLAA